MVRQRTMLINALRGHLAEYGVVTGVGAGGVTAMLKALHEQQDKLPVHARSALHALAVQLRALSSEVDRLEAQILAWHRADETRRDEPTARHNTRYRSDHRVRHISGSAGCLAVPIWAIIRSMARAYPASEQLRR